MFLDGMLRLEAAVGVEVVVGRRASVHHPVSNKVMRCKIDSSASLKWSIPSVKEVVTHFI